MIEILVSHPLIIVYLVYVLGVLVAAFWPDTPGGLMGERRGAGCERRM